VGDYPVKAPPRPRRIEARTVLLLRCGERWAIRKRAEKGLLARMWELPNVEGSLSEAQAAAAVRALGGVVLSCAALGEAKHVFTHVEWHMRGFLLTLSGECPGFVWESAAAIRETRSVPTAFRAYLARMD
jgi:A/G-specific adenine glycosylase